MRDFLLPLCKGGALQVGAPLGGPRATLVLERAMSKDRGGPDVRALAGVAAARGALARSLLCGAPDPPLDESTVCLAIVLHDLLALGHPDLLGSEAHQVRVRERTLAALMGLARIGRPDSALQTVYRHTVVVRSDEIERPEHAVSFWLGERTYVGRPVPRRVRALGGLRRVRVVSTQRRWLAEIGLPPGGRPVWELIQEASPLGEALDPTRLDPQPSWSRLLSVIRFAPLARLVAGRVLALGLRVAGEALSGSLLNHHASLDGGPPACATAVRFLAHVFWLQHLARLDSDAGPALSAILLSAHDLGPPGRGLLYPADVPDDRDHPLGRDFAHRITGLRSRLHGFEPGQLPAARALCKLAAAAQAG